MQCAPNTIKSSSNGDALPTSKPAQLQNKDREEQEERGKHGKDGEVGEGTLEEEDDTEEEGANEDGWRTKGCAHQTLVFDVQCRTARARSVRA